MRSMQAAPSSLKLTPKEASAEAHLVRVRGGVRVRVRVRVRIRVTVRVRVRVRVGRQRGPVREPEVGQHEARLRR